MICGVLCRALLRRVIQRGYDDGYTTKVGPEFEFFNYDEDSESLHAKGYRFSCSYYRGNVTVKPT